VREKATAPDLVAAMAAAKHFAAISDLASRGLQAVIPRSVRSNAIAPKYTMSPITQSIRSTFLPEAHASTKATLGRDRFDESGRKSHH
jgi:NAD(P)-dependent dehydrogenase (short-subunit alcohol dehydrogenase family)